MTKIRLLKDIGELKSGEIIETSKAAAKAYISKGKADLIDEDTKIKVKDMEKPEDDVNKLAREKGISIEDAGGVIQGRKEKVMVQKGWAEQDEKKQWAQRYRDQYGFNVIPAKTEEKLPKIAWKKYQDEFPDEETFKSWKYENIFLILGKISNNTIEIDVDVPNVKLEDIFSDVKAARETLLIAESSQGKKKIYVKAKDIKEKIDLKVSNEAIGTNKKGEPIYPHAEYRGEAHGSILPPSKHPDGTIYKWLNLNEKGELPELQEINADKLYENIVKRLREKFGYIPEKKEEITEKITGEKKRKTRPRLCFMMSQNNGDKWSNEEGHNFRSAYAWELILCNYSDEEIYDAFKKHDEISGEKYDKEITEKQVTGIRKKATYKWFCKTLQDKCRSIVSQYCEECSKREKEDTALYVSNFSLPEGKQLEEIKQDGKYCFLLYDSKTDKNEIVEDYQYDDQLIKPFIPDDKLQDQIIFPDGVEEYGTLNDLIEEMNSFALAEYDPVDFPELYELTIDINLTSWVSPVWQKNMAEKFIPIVNARGPSETGKKRFLTIDRWLTYHSFYTLKTQRVPTLFRVLSPLNGTLIMDEADMDDSNLNSELVEFLNSRCDGVGIPRYSTESGEVEGFNSFGLTIMATRKGFTDDGMESRTTVFPTSTTDSPEKYDLIPPPEWLERGKQLQRKLLLFRLRHLHDVMPTQLLITNISSFRVREALLVFQKLKDEDPKLLERVTKLAAQLQDRIIKERAACPEGLMLNYIYSVLDDEESFPCLKKQSTCYAIYYTMKDDKGDDIVVPLNLGTLVKGLGNAFSASEIAKMWRGMQQETYRMKRVGKKRYRGVILIKNLNRLEKIFPKYVSDYAKPFGLTNVSSDLDDYVAEG